MAGHQGAHEAHDPMNLPVETGESGMESPRPREEWPPKIGLHPMFDVIDPA